MKSHHITVTALPAATVSMLSLFCSVLSSAEHTSLFHPGAPEPASRESNSVTGRVPALNVPVESAAVTQNPPGTIGKDWPAPVEDSQWFSSVLVDQLEYRMKEGADTIRWDAVGWYGGDYDRLWIKTEGDWRTSGERGGEAEAQALYGRLIAPFWDLQIGVRYDQYSGTGFDRSRSFLVLGLQGLAPYWFDLEPALFVSQEGDVSARLTATYDILLTQRLALQPRFDIDAALQSAEKFGVGEGVNAIGLGLRLRYEVIREVAPYLGIHYLCRMGETADLARTSGDRAREMSLVAGMRFWF